MLLYYGEEKFFKSSFILEEVALESEEY